MAPRLARTLEILSLPLAVVTVILIGGIVYQNGQAFHRSRILEKQAEAAIRDLDSLRTQLVDAETGQRGYLLTGRDQYDLIFGVFKRLHSGREYAGTGIGLGTCKRIVEIHGGMIWVKSQVGEGTTFYFRLPAQAGGSRAMAVGS